MIIAGDCLDILPTIDAESVQCCVTSPPYWGLRDYGIDGQLGLEKTPEEYVAKMVAVFREVRRVLRDDGTLWLNLGDSYAAQRGGTHQPAETLAGGEGEKTADGARVNRDRHDGYNPTRNASAIGLKHKDLIGIPWRVAFALQADGWWLRQDIIWHKPNPMPESVTDRCTKAHEYIFLLTKSARYFYDNEAVKEAAAYGIPNSPESIASPYGQGFTRRADSWRGSRFDDGKNLLNHPNIGKQRKPVGMRAANRNKRSVWTISTKPFSEAHFATFPPEIPEICIKAGSKQGDTILDPFSGSGTTGNVALRLDRQFVGIELNPQYLEMAERRIAEASLPLLERSAQ